MRIGRDGASADRGELGEETTEPRSAGSRRAALGGVAGGVAMAASGLLLPARLVEETEAADHPVRRIQGRKDQRRKKRHHRRKHRRKVQRRRSDQLDAQDDKPPGKFCLLCVHRIHWSINYNFDKGFSIRYGYFDDTAEWWGGATSFNYLGQGSLDFTPSTAPYYQLSHSSYVSLQIQTSGPGPDPYSGPVYFFHLRDDGGIFSQVALLTIGANSNGRTGWIIDGSKKPAPPWAGPPIVADHELQEFGHYDWSDDGYSFRVERLADEADNIYRAKLTVQRP